MVAHTPLSRSTFGRPAQMHRLPHLAPPAPVHLPWAVACELAEYLFPGMTVPLDALPGHEDDWEDVGWDPPPWIKDD